VYLLLSGACMDGGEYILSQFEYSRMSRQPIMCHRPGLGTVHQLATKPPNPLLAFLLPIFFLPHSLPDHDIYALTRPLMDGCPTMWTWKPCRTILIIKERYYLVKKSVYLNFPLNHGLQKEISWIENSNILQNPYSSAEEKVVSYMSWHWDISEPP
jgi:hypothetical protein